MENTTSRFFGYDNDARIIDRARINARNAGLSELIRFTCQDVLKLTNPLPQGPGGTVLSNPLTVNVWTASRRLLLCMASWGA